MRKFSEITGLTVTEGGSGRTLGRITGVLLTKAGQKVTGLALRGKGLFRRRRFVPYSDIRHFGERTVEVSRTVKKGMENERPLLGQTVRGTSGVHLGWVTDGLLEEETGQVSAVEVSYGLYEDFSLGRSLMHDFILRPEGVVVLSGAAFG